MGSLPYVTADAAGTRIDIYVQPGAARLGFAGVHGAAIKLKVRAPARDGRANEAVIEFLADVLDVAKSAIELTSGPSSRNKKFLIRDVDAETVAARLNDAQEGSSHR